MWHNAGVSVDPPLMVPAFVAYGMAALTHAVAPSFKVVSASETAAFALASHLHACIGLLNSLLSAHLHARNGSHACNVLAPANINGRDAHGSGLLAVDIGINPV